MEYSDLDSSRATVPHSTDLPIHRRLNSIPKSGESEDEQQVSVGSEWSTVESGIWVYREFIPKESQLSLIARLNLSMRQSEILIGAMIRWDIVDNDVKIGSRQSCTNFEENDGFVCCKETFQLLAYCDYSSDNWWLFIESSKELESCVTP